MSGTESFLRVLAGALTTALALAFAGPARALDLPRFDGPLALERAVELALEQSLRVRAAGASARVAVGGRSASGL